MYKDADEKKYEEPFSIDLTFAKTLRHIRRPVIEKELEKIRKCLEGIQRHVTEEKESD